MSMIDILQVRPRRPSQPIEGLTLNMDTVVRLVKLQLTAPFQERLGPSAKSRSTGAGGRVGPSA